MSGEESERTGRTYRSQSIITKIIIRVLIFGVLLFFAYLLLPDLGVQITVYLIIIVSIIMILSGNWIKSHPLIQLILIGALITFIILLLLSTFLVSTGLINQRQYDGFIGRISESSFRIRESSGNFSLFGSWRQFQDRQVAIATGNHFTGQVEQNKEDVDLGLHLERLESFGMDIVEGREAVFWVTLKGKSLGDKIIKGRIGCNASEGDDKRLTPAKEFSIFSYEMNQYDCRFSSLPGDRSVKITFWTEYSFRTLGYKKAYFIDIDRLRTLRSLNKDPLIEAGISDRNPISIYTSGPVNIGIGTSDYQPIPIQDNDDRIFILGITLQTNPRWKGRISKINDLEIQIHKSMYIPNPSLCDHQFEETNNLKCKERCEGVQECEMQCGEYNFYRLSDNELKNIKNINNFRTFKCPIYVFTREDLLGDSPVSTRFVRVVADYDFKSEIDRIFFIKKDN